MSKKRVHLITVIEPVGYPDPEDFYSHVLFGGPPCNARALSEYHRSDTWTEANPDLVTCSVCRVYLRGIGKRRLRLLREVAERFENVKRVVDERQRSRSRRQAIKFVRSMRGVVRARSAKGEVRVSVRTPNPKWLPKIQAALPPLLRYVPLAVTAARS